ncbi:MAG: DinB family protein [bacterium]
MDSQAASSKTIANALPAYKWNTEFTEKVIAKLTPELFDWRPETKDGSWHFSLGELAAHIVDAGLMFYGQLSGDEFSDGDWFMKPPENFEGGSGEWMPTREFTLEDVKAKFAEMRAKFAEVLAWPIEKAHEPTPGTEKAFKEWEKQVEEGKFPKEFLANGPATPVRVIATLISHEAAHRGTLLTLMRVFHGISFAERES